MSNETRMNQTKTGKRGHKLTEEEKAANFKTPEMSEAIHVNGTETKDDQNSPTQDSLKSKIHTRARSNTPVTNLPSQEAGNLTDTKGKKQESPVHAHNTRQRSKTPQNISLDIINELTENITEVTKSQDQNVASTTIENVASGELDTSVEKEEDDVIPELQFDENDIDIESEGSPNRCKTRRSQTLLVSTPKTPNVFLDEDLIIPTQVIYNPDLDISDSQSSVSIDNVSTTAVAGDVSRNVDVTLDMPVEETSYTSPDMSLSFQETLRNLSSRRTIRPITQNYRKVALTNRLKSTDAASEYTDYDLIERVTGVKRKSSSVQLNDSKKLKESSGFFSRLTSPIYNLKKSLSSNKPKTKEYEDKKPNSDSDIATVEINGVGKAEQNWCSIM